MLSTREAANKLGLDPKTLSRYIASGKVPAPTIFKAGRASLHGWTEKDIERVRQLLPKIANGRKTRYKKKPQPGPAVPHKQSHNKKQSAVGSEGSAKPKPKKA